MRQLCLLPLITFPLAFAQTINQYVVHNLCPTSINLYIGGDLDSTIPTGGDTTKFLGLDAGFFYTNINGGNQNGAATRTGFFLEQDYYYIVKNTDHFNTGVRITPRGQPSRMGFCASAECDDASCTTAFSTPPTRFPPHESTAPRPPLYECPFTNITYDIYFCPTGTFPGQPLTWHIHPNFGNINKCLDVRGAVFANGTPVQIYDCNGTPAQSWNINRGTTKVQLAGTNFCLDAGSNPSSGVGMKIWQCYDNLPAQQWYYTDDNRIAVDGEGQCLDLTNGVLTNGKKVQIWQCTDYNANQVWTL